MEILTMIAQLILSLSILVILHELGHFIPAKLFGTRVEKFYLFFNPWFSLWKKKIGGTEYGLGWLPLGGYVKIAGMVDESMDKEFMNRKPEPWEFRSKPAWQRLIIMIGGVTVNFVLGFLIFSFLLARYGEAYLPSSELKYGIAVNPLGERIGFKDGDHIVSLDGKPFKKFEPGLVIKDIMLANLRDIKVLRDGMETDIHISQQAVSDISAHQKEAVEFATVRMPVVVGELQKGSAAEASGMKPDDKIIGINNNKVLYFDQLSSKLDSLKGTAITVNVERGGQPLALENVAVSADGKLGFTPYGPAKFFNFSRKNYSLAEALPAGVGKGVNFLGDQLKGFGQMFSGKIKASESLGGFASITKLFPRQWDWERFWYITAILSIILGFMNLLPIPALDGGYIMFLIWEIITGRKVSEKVMEVATTIGIVLLLILMVYANGLDILRALK